MTHAAGPAVTPKPPRCGQCAQPATDGDLCGRHAAHRRRCAALARIVATAMTDDEIAEHVGLDAAAVADLRHRATPTAWGDRR